MAKKQESGKKQKVTVVNGVLTCHYPTIGKTFSRQLSKYPKGIYVPCDAADHGIEQKFGDAKSGCSPEEKYEEVLKIDASLLDGTWNRTSGPIDRTPEILAAVAALKNAKVVSGTLVRDDGTKLKPTEEMVKSWGNNEEVRVEINRQRLARAEKLLAESKATLEIEFK